jgi:DNA-binding IclR family transcriptional regulator
MAEWSILTNHALALVCIAHDPGVRLRDIAAALDISERSAFAIVADLTEAGYVVKKKNGRRNRYQIQGHLPLRDSVARERTIGEMLDVLVTAGHLPLRDSVARERTIGEVLDMLVKASPI